MKSKSTADSIVLGVSGEALLVLGLIIAFADKPQWNSFLTVLLALTGLFLSVWSIVFSKKRKSENKSVLTIILFIMGILSLAIGIMGYFELFSLLILGISGAVIGVVSDIVLSVVSKKDKKSE